MSPHDAERINRFELREESDDLLQRALDAAKAKRVAAHTKAMDCGNVFASIHSQAYRSFTPSPIRVTLYRARGRELTLKEWGEVSGINWHTLASRLNLGLNMTEALVYKRKPGGPAPKKFTIGEHTRTIAEWADSLGIAEAKFRARLIKGLTVAEALAWRPTKEIGRLYEANGDTHNLTRWSQISGLGRPTLRYRVLSRGMTMAEALAWQSRPKRGPKTNITRGGLHEHNGELRTKQEWADLYGVRYGTLTGRLRRGLTLAEALTIENKNGLKTRPDPSKAIADASTETGGWVNSQAESTRTGGVFSPQDSPELGSFSTTPDHSLTD